MAVYRYDEAGDLMEACDALGSSYRYEYVEHLLVKVSNKNGLWFYFQYDGVETRTSWRSLIRSARTPSSATMTPGTRRRSPHRMVSDAVRMSMVRIPFRYLCALLGTLTSRACASTAELQRLYEDAELRQNR